MILRCGIVGLPNAGKSTLFNAVTNSCVTADNYPFCTIKPNFGVVEVPDLRLIKLTELIKPKKTISSVIELVDIAGLVSGASMGAGLGNQFLSHIKNVDAILNVVRCFENDKITHVSERIDPIDDIKTIEEELILSDIQTAEKALKALSKKENTKQLIRILGICLTQLNQTKPIRELNFSSYEKSLIESISFLTIKPIMYIANISNDRIRNIHLLNHLYKFFERSNIPIIEIPVLLEEEISKLPNPEDRLEFLDDLKIEKSGLNHLIKTAFNLLDLQTFFTVGQKEVRSWAIPKGMKAQQAAKLIHTDISRGFIRVQIIDYKDFIKYNNHIGAKQAGKMRVEGKEYILKDGDIVNFLFNV